MGRTGFAKSAVLGLGCGLALSPGAKAQALDIPLQYEEDANGLILTANIGIDGQAPRPYLFDTGSNLFNAYYSASAFGSVPASMASPTAAYPNGLPTGVTYSYGDTSHSNVFVGDIVATPSLTFYPTSTGASSGVTLKATTPSGASSSFIINAIYQHTEPNVVFDISKPLLGYGSFGGYYGIFGADTVAGALTGTTTNTTSVNAGGVLGQAVVPGTTAGYIVAANGQSANVLPGAPGASGAATSGQSVTSCSPCVIAGLTPALLAQFKPANTLSAASTGTSFPVSGAPSLGHFGIELGVSLKGPQGASAAFFQPTLLDTGTPTNIIENAKLSGTTLWPDGSTATLSDRKTGSTTTTYSVASRSASAPPSPYVVQTTTFAPTPNNSTGLSYLGIAFFMQNSVLFNLAGQAIGYTPNFVTDANISTTSAAPLTIGADSVPLGLAGVISGPGGVVVTRGGSATLSGANAYTGATTISGGALALVGPGSIAASSGVAVSAGGLFDISGTSAGATIASLSGDASGAVALGAQRLTLANASGVYAGAISGAGGLTLAAGFETLTGAAGYTGATTVNGGVLEVDGAIAKSSSVAVNAGGALTGDGVIDPSAVTIASGGVLAPGAPSAPGTAMTIDGALVLQSGARYAVETSAAQASKAQVNGTATLGGATVEWAPQPLLGKASGGTYPILAASSLSGAFSPVVATATTSAVGVVASGAPSLVYDAHDVSLTLPAYTITLQAPSDAPSNARNAAGGIDAAIVAGAAPPAGFQNLARLSGAALSGAVDQIAGQPGGAFVPVGFAAGDMALAMALNPFLPGRDAGFGASPAPEASAYAQDPLAARADAALPATRPAPPQFAAWGGGYGGVGSISGDAATGAAGVTSQIYGFLAGLDDHVSANATVGLALGGGVTNWELDQAMGAGRSGMAQAILYGSSRSGPAYVSGAVAYSWQDATTSRVVSLAGSDTLQGAFDAHVLSSRLEAGYRLPAFGALPANFGVTPYAAAEGQGLFMPAYGETAAPGSSSQFALGYGAHDFSTLRGELGAWFDSDLPVAAGGLKFYSRVAWAHDFVKEGAIAAVFQDLPGSSFLVNTAKPAPNDALVTAGLEFRLADGWSILAKFDGEFSSTTSSYAGSGVLRKVW